jgi:hypothetical protein
VGVREHVLLADALGSYSLEEIETAWMDMVKFHALTCALNRDWEFSPATSDSDLEHLEKYIQKIKDTKFRQRLTAAVEEFFAQQRRSTHFADVKGPIVYETDVLAVHKVYYVGPEDRYGFHFKDTNEFGLYLLFYFDDGGKHEGFYRSDQKFEAENGLDHLYTKEQI